MSGETLVEWTYFKKADGQRSLNTTQLGRLELDLATVTPFVSGGIVSTRQRPNMEIDQRVRQQRTTAGLGGLVHLGGRSRLRHRDAPRKDRLQRRRPRRRHLDGRARK